MKPPPYTTKITIIMIKASIVMALSGITLCESKSFGDEFIKSDEHDNGHSPLEQYGSDRSFGKYIHPVSRICLVAVPEPPDQHGDQLDGEENHDEIVECFAHFELLARACHDFLAELFRPDLQNKEYEERPAYHQAQPPDPILIVKKTHADGRWNPEDKTGCPHDGDCFFSCQSGVHEDAGNQFQLGDER